LTDRGARHAGVTYTDLAIAMWGEIKALEDSETKTRILRRVSHRMGKSFHDLLPAGTIEERMRDMAGVLAGRRIPTSFGTSLGLPVIEFHACPYPDLVRTSEDRAVCDLEQRVMSEAIGQEVELSQCRLDGHGCCQFKPVIDPASTSRHVCSHGETGSSSPQ
jgi:predicted ArsR family transcriptional regulator